MYAITLRPVAPSTTSRNCCSIAFWKLRRISWTASDRPCSISVRSTRVKPPRSRQITVSLTR
jgi:hypothetical protein